MSGDARARSFQRRVVATARRGGWLGALFNRGGRQRARILLEQLAEWIPPPGLALDVGAGMAHVAEALDMRGFRVLACDVHDLRFAAVPLVRATGAALPFASGAFDLTMIVTVLHHVPAAEHDAFIDEALRTLRHGGRLILLEDVFHTEIGRRATHFMDSLMNLEFAGHPHSNRTLAAWTALVQAKPDATIRRAHEWVAWWGPFRMRHGLVVIDKRTA